MRLVGPAKAKELVFTGRMIPAEEAFRLGLVNSVISLTPDELPPEVAADDKDKQKERNNQIAKLLNNKLMNECIAMAKQISKNSFNAVKVSKMLVNRGMDADLDTGLRLEIYGWSLCFAHEDRKKMMSDFLNKSKK
jgi:3-hydroxypropionyl-coenzyme A dehydratase